MDELEDILADIDALLARRARASALRAKRPAGRRRSTGRPNDESAQVLPLRRRTG